MVLIEVLEQGLICAREHQLVWCSSSSIRFAGATWLEQVKERSESREIIKQANPEKLITVRTTLRVCAEETVSLFKSKIVSMDGFAPERCV